MAPIRTKKRVSDANTASKRAARFDAIAAPVKADEGTETPSQQSPVKKTRTGISLAQKQALIENLQIELTERARRLRAQYNLQAQGLRTRVEIRVNRIPMALRRLKMSDLIAKLMADQQRRIASASKPPPVPAKDYPPIRNASPQKNPFGPLLQTSARPVKRKSLQVGGHDKENDAVSDNPKKRIRAGPSEHMELEPSKVLSPASSNSRIAPRPHEKPALPPKPDASRRASPIKAATLPASGRAANILSGVAEKTKAARGTGTTTRKPVDLPSSSADSTMSTGYAAPRTTTARNRTAPTPVLVTAPAAPSRKVTNSRDGMRTSVSSESSSSSSVPRGPMASRAPVATPGPAPISAAKKTVMGTIKKGVAGATTKKATATKPTTASAAGAGRVLRRRA